jgi:predicted nucleic acid-binding protein
VKVLDTTFLVDLLRGKKEAKRFLDTKELLFTTQINMFEVIRGFFLAGISAKKLAEVRTAFDNIRVLPLDDNATIRAAEISADLVKRGAGVAEGDCLTAGIALSNGIETIVTNDFEHFRRIKGIKVESY